jgi:protein-tyrosine phosphatase
MGDVPVSALQAEILNFRDLGGFSVGPGREFRRGVVFRTQALTGLSLEAVAELRDLGITHAVDLRMEHERTSLPVILPPSMTVVIADVMAQRADSAVVEAGAATSAGSGSSVTEHSRPTSGRAMMAETYRDFIRLPSAQAAYAQFLRTVIEADGATAVYCAAGKDRTGWAAALLQTFAGVDPAVVSHEYVASNEHLVSRYAPRIQAERDSGGDVDALLALVDANPDYLASALACLVDDYGDVDGYLIHGLGLSERDLELLRDRVTGPVNVSQ